MLRKVLWNRTHPRSARHLLWAAGSTIILDLWTKTWAVRRFQAPSGEPVYPGWLQWHLLYNSGASFGWFSGHTHFLIVVSVIACIGLVYWGLTEPDNRLSLALGLILGGAAGNLYDRSTLGAVRDFIDVWFWPAVFNVSDVAIRFGVLLVLLLLFRPKAPSRVATPR